MSVIVPGTYFVCVAALGGLWDLATASLSGVTLRSIFSSRVEQVGLIFSSTWIVVHSDGVEDLKGTG